MCMFCVGVILPYDNGTFAAELFLVFIVASAAMIQIRIGQPPSLYVCDHHCLCCYIHYHLTVTHDCLVCLRVTLSLSLSVCVAGPQTWNDFPEDVTSAESLTTFHRVLKSVRHLCRMSFPD